MNGWKHMHHTSYRKPYISPFLMFLVVFLLLTGGFKWLFFAGLFLLPMMFWGKQMWQCGGEDEKRKNDEKQKRDDLFYNNTEVEII